MHAGFKRFNGLFRSREAAIASRIGLVWRSIPAMVLLAAAWVVVVLAVSAQPASPGRQDGLPVQLDGSGAAFDVTWSTSCQTPPDEAVTALDYAAGLWGAWISSTVPIEVLACWTPNLSGGDALGTGAPIEYVCNFAGAPLVDTFYPIALANALSGVDLEPGRADIILQFKADAAWSFAITTTHLSAPADGEDFVTVALHELAHGLSFIGNMYEEYNVGFCGGYLYPCPTPYDWFTVDSAGVPLLDYLSPDPRELGARLESDANFGGPNTLTANGGTAAKLYTPGVWQSGSSLSHLDSETFQVGENRLMTPSYSGVTRHPGPVTLAMLQDMGWLRADGTPNLTASGPHVVSVGQAVTFTGTLLWSGYTAQAITYTWTASDHPDIVHTGRGITDSATFNWPTPGLKTVMVTATGMDVPASATLTVWVSYRVYVPLVLR